MRRLSRLVPRIDAIVAGQLDEMAKLAERDGAVDLLEHFALPIPSLTICELLGIPYADRLDFQRLSAARFDFLGGAGGTFGAISESVGYLVEVVKAQRAEPGPGLLGMLVREHGDDITDLELAGLTDGLLTGGLETTASMLALGALVLVQDPDCLADVRDRDEAAAPFVEELLRYLTVVQVAFPRFAREDITIGGRRIIAGDMVFCSLSAANRDARQGPDMERLRESLHLFIRLRGQSQTPARFFSPERESLPRLPGGQGGLDGKDLPGLVQKAREAAGRPRSG